MPESFAAPTRFPACVKRRMISAAAAVLPTFMHEPSTSTTGFEIDTRGSGFSEGLKLTVGGQEAKLIKVEPNEVRFEMPKVEGKTGSVHQVVVTHSGRNVPPSQIYLGRLPLVASVEPARGVAGDLVRVRGAGFSGDTTAVRVDGQPALVVAGHASELVVVVPPSSRVQPEVLVPVTVQTGGRTSAEAPIFTLQRLVEGRWVPVFFAGHVGEGGTAGQATVGTELGPVLTGLMLSGRSGAGIATELGTMRISEQIDALETMAVSPIQYLVTPRVVAEVIDGERRVELSSPKPRRGLPESVARTVGAMMKATTTSGTAYRGFHDRRGRRVLSVDVAGKTGSLDRDQPSYLSYSWFVGYAPADKPEVAIAVLLANPPAWYLKAHQAAAMVLDAMY